MSLSTQIAVDTVPLTKPARLPDGVAVAAIGDIHGHLDLLEALLAHLDEVEWPNVQASHKFQISLGDVADRGPRGIACYDRLRVGSACKDVRTEVLWGNHDLMLALILQSDGPFLDQLIDQWGAWGGREVLREMRDFHGLNISFDPETFAGKMVAALGDERVAFFADFKDNIRLGDFLFVHAGIDPRRHWQESLADERWNFLVSPYAHWAFIREPFLSGEHDFPGLVVHGHSPERTPAITDFRIGIDTGAFHTGTLTAALINTDANPGVVKIISATRVGGAA